MDSGLYKVVVKTEKEIGYNEKTGETKYKKSTLNYIVRSGSTKDASERVEKEFNGFTDEWRIDSVKELNVEAILE